MPMVIMAQTKFEAIIPKDVKADAFLAKTGVPPQGLDCNNILLLAPVVTILIFLGCL